MNTSYIKNFNLSEFMSLFDKLESAVQSSQHKWCGTVYVGTRPLYLECNVQWMTDKIEQYFVNVLPNVKLENTPELYVINKTYDVFAVPDTEKTYVCCLGDNIYKRPDLIINPHCVFIKKSPKYIMALNDDESNFLYLGENHLLMKLFNYIFDEPNFAVVHGAVVGHNGCGILITGMSGYGKSTLSAHCMARGLQFVGDDRIALCKNSDGLFANPIYTTISLGDNIPSQLQITDTVRPTNSTKDILILDKSQISENIKITAVLEPQKSNCKTPEIIDTKPGHVITRMCMDFSTFNVLTPSKNQIGDWHKIFDLMTGISFYNIKLSESISDNVSAIINFIKP